MTANKLMLALCSLAAVFMAQADSSISQIVVSQRWPWSEKVDVDFVLNGDATDVEITAKWDGHYTPFSIGSIRDCSPGHHRVTWDPAESPYANQVLAGFKVSVTTRAYLVLDLVKGGYYFLSDVPKGGWREDYKSSKMVFRRIPAGRYTLGETRETYDFLGAPSNYASIWNRRTVTFTSDFYVAIFKFTEAQYETLATGYPGASYKPKKISYYALRGERDSADWPLKGYNVAQDSIVSKLREKSCGELLIDLCEEEQWEVAARAGTTSILPNGVTMRDSLLALTNKLDEISAWYGTVGGDEEVEVGLFAANDWGLYDVVGLMGEWTLDSGANTKSLPKYGLGNSTDPIGYNGTSDFRVFRTASANYEGVDIRKILPCSRQMADAAALYSCTTRFCIHLKPLVEEGTQQ